MTRKKDFQTKISDFIATHQLLEEDGRYLIGLSGGADSVALLLILCELGYKVEAVHCNFRLRGDEADRDERFCQLLCDGMGVPLHRAHFDTRAYAEMHKVSIELAARELRYAYFEQLRQTLQMNSICVAHHRDDQVETVLMNLIRGTGVKGMKGMSPRNGNVIRPLLCVSRDEIEDFLSQRGQDYVIDSTNLVPDATRNYIRLNVIPILKVINPAVCENVFQTALHMAEVQKVLSFIAEPSLMQLKSNGFIERKQIYSAPSPICVLFEILTPYGFSPAQIAQIASAEDSSTGKVWRSKSHEVLIDRNRIYMEAIGAVKSVSMKIPEIGTYVVSGNVKLRIEVQTIDKDFSVYRKNDSICLDYSKIRFPIEIRTCTLGDRFVPFGMSGSRLVSDFLTDRKKTLFEKRRQLVLTNSNSDILWVVNERSDNRYRITEESKKALVVSVEML